VKRQTGRGRPDAHLDDMVIRGRPQTGLGFPSGHSAVATTVAVAAWPVVPPPVRVAVVAAAAATAGARVFVGAHLPLDVAGGVAMGVVAGCVARSVAAAATPVS
jgi:undecaprenyl-diphosphatase